MTVPDPHLERITLTHYRCFGQLEIDLHPRLTVLVAHNGGRTTAVFDPRPALGLARCSRPLSPATVSS